MLTLITLAHSSSAAEQWLLRGIHCNVVISYTSGGGNLFNNQTKIVVLGFPAKAKATSFQRTRVNSCKKN